MRRHKVNWSKVKVPSVAAVQRAAKEHQAAKEYQSVSHFKMLARQALDEGAIILTTDDGEPFTINGVVIQYPSWQAACEAAEQINATVGAGYEPTQRGD